MCMEKGEVVFYLLGALGLAKRSWATSLPKPPEMESGRQWGWGTGGRLEQLHGESEDPIWVRKGQG